MKLTNFLNLPPPIFNAIARDPYTRGDADISITGLLEPPRIRVLKKRHWDELTEDVSDRIYSLLGQVIHGILERAAADDKDKTLGDLFEKRFYTKINGWTVSGQMDAVYADGEIQDYKLLSYFKVANGVPEDFEAQLNMYAALLRLNGIDVKRLSLVCLFRDWSKGKAQKDPLIPQQQGKKFDVMLWSQERALAFLEERVKLHQEAERVSLPLCSSEDQWRRPDKWAVMAKRGAPRATRLLDSRVAADAFAKALGKGAYVEERRGFPVRCQSWCAVRDFCKQFTNERKTYKGE